MEHGLIAELSKAETYAGILEFEVSGYPTKAAVDPSPWAGAKRK
jgi:hypothetical protein